MNDYITAYNDYSSRWRAPEDTTHDSLSSTRGRLLGYAESYRNQFSGDSDSRKYFGDVIGMLKGTSPNSVRNMYGSYQNEGEYKQAVKRYQEEQAALNRPLEEYQREIDALTKRRNKAAADYDRAMEAESSDIYTTKNILADLDKQLDALKNSKWKAENHQKFSGLGNNADFAEKSRIVDASKATGFFGDYTYAFINDINGRRENALIEREGNAYPDAALKKYTFMSEDEKANYNYLYQTQGKKAANEYLDYISYDLDSRRMLDYRQGYADYAKKHPVLASAVSVPTNLMSVLGLLDVAGQYAARTITGEYRPINYNSLGMNATGATTAIRGTVSQGLADKFGTIQISEEDHPVLAKMLNGKSAGDVYQLGMSMLDSSATAALGAATGLGAAGTVLLGGSAGSQGVLTALEKGADDRQALAMGILNGTFEALFEYVSLDKLLNGETKSILRSFFEQGFVEGTEELNTTLFNTIADVCVMAENSDYSRAMQEYMEKGMSQKQAAVQAMQDIAIGMGWDFVGGLLSGGIMAGGKTAIGNGYQQFIAEPHYYSQTYGGSVEELVAESLEINPDNALAQKIQAKLAENKRVSGFDLRGLVNQNESDLTAQDMDAIRNSVEQQLEAYGEEGDIPDIAEAIAKQAAGERLSANEARTVAESAYGERVANELNPENIRSGQFSSTWAEGIGTNRINADEYSRLVQEAQESPEYAADNGASVYTSEAETPQGGAQGEAQAQAVNDVPEANAGNTEGQAVSREAPAPAAENRQSDAKQMTIESASAKYGKQAGAFVHTYQQGQDVQKYDAAYSAAYEMGKSGVPMSTVNRLSSTSYLTETQRELAHAAGMAAANSQATAQAKQNGVKQNSKPKTRKRGTVRGEGVTTADLKKTFNDPQNRAYKVLSKFSEATGVDIVLYRSQANEKGIFTQEEGRFSWNEDTIYIDLNAGLSGISDVQNLSKYTMLRTFSHEFTHFLEKWSPEQYNEFRSLVFEAMNRKMAQENANSETQITVDDLIQRKLDTYRAKLGDSFTYEDASREVVADAMTDILPEASFIETLYNENRTLFDKVLEKLKGFLADLKAYFESITTNTKKEAGYLKEEVGGTMRYVQDVVDAFDKLALKGVENYQTAKASTTAETATADGLTPAKVKSVVSSDGKSMFQLRTMKQDLDSYMQDLVDAGLVGDGKAMSNDELTGLYESINRVMNYVEKHITEIERNEGFREMDGSNRPFLPYKDNSDPHYRMALDYSTLCRKRLLTQAITERLQASLKRALTPVEQVKIRNEIKKLQEEGKKIDVACALCYVEAARLKSPKVINEFLNNKADSLKNYFSLKNKRFKNEVYQKRLGDWKESKGLPRNATKNDIKNAGLKVADFNKFAKDVRSGYWAWLETADPETFAKENAVIRAAEGMDNEKFLNATDLAKMRRDNADLYDAFIFKVRSATRSKAQETDVPYKRGDINRVGQAIIDQMNEESGFRHQSWSDFQAMHLLDTISAIIELSTRKAKVHTYTKVADMVRFIGETGVMVNMSLIPNGNSGLNEDGTLDFDPVEGMDYQTMLDLRQQFPETAGNIAIGISDEQILALLASNDVDYVIPYHTSGLNADMRRRMGIRSWKDYTKTQNESGDGEGPKLREWFNEKEAQDYADGYAYMVEASKKYLDLCYERGITPKFPQFLKKGSDGRYQLREDAQNYWKLLVDRKMVNQVTRGVIIQKAVLPKFNEDTMLDILSAEVNSQAAKDAREAEDLIVNKLLNEPAVFTKAELEQARIIRDAAIRMAIENTAIESGVSDQSQKEQLSVRDSAYDEMSYAEIQQKQQDLYARENALRDRKRAAENNTELKKAMDDQYALFSEMTDLLRKRKQGNATDEDLSRIEEIKASRDDYIQRVADVQERIGLNAIYAEEKSLREESNALRKAADAAWEREGAEKEARAIEKSGLTAEEYFRKKAVKTFHYTTNFNEAGYMLPDGKLLNFSGGERNHRYRDHREIGEIYEATNGAAALNRFLSDGNIRIMAESPGVDLASGVSPTEEQYTALRRFINSHGTKEGQFFVDFSDREGHRAGNYSYDGRVSAERIISDIKHFYKTGEVRQQSSVAEFHNQYQLRDSNLSDAEVLSIAAEAVRENDSRYNWLSAADRDALNIFAKKAAALDKAQKLRADLLEQKHYLEENKATRKRGELAKVQNNLNTVNSHIKRAEADLAKVENQRVLKKVLKQARAVVERDTHQRGREELQAYKNQRNDTEAARKYRKRCADTAMELSEWLRKNSDKQHVPEVLKKPVLELLTSIDFSSKRFLNGGDMTIEDKKFGANLAELHRLLQGQQGAMDGDDNAIDSIGAYMDISVENRQFLNDLVSKLAAVDGTFTINRMTTEELRDFSKFLKNLTTAIRQANRALANARYKNIPEMAHRSMQHMESMGNAKAAAGTNAARFVQWTNATPYYAFKRFGDVGETLFDGFTRGWEKLAFNAQEIIDFTEKTYTAGEIRKWRKEIHSIKLEDGSEIRMTTAQIMELSQLINREQARKHIVAGGIRIGNIQSKKGTVQDVNHYHFTSGDLNKVVGLLNDRQLEVAQKLRKYMGKQGGEWGNEISMARFGYEFYTEGENYYTIRTDSNGRPMKDTDEQTNSMFRLLNLSASKSLNPKANNALIVSDIFDTFADHMSDMAKLNALGLPLLDAIKWYNYTERVNNSDGTMDEEGVKKSMEMAFGAAGGRYFKTLLKDINGAKESGDRGGDLAGKMISNYKVAAVAANLRVALLQPTSYVRAMYVIKPKNMANAMLFKRNAHKEAMQYSGTAVWKSLGYYDTDIARSMRSQIEHDETWLDAVKEKSMFLAELGDQRTWGRLWVACKLEAKDRNSSLEGEALKQATADIFREVIYATQVMDSTLTRSEMMRGSTKWTKLATAFMAEPTLSANILMDCASQYSIDKRQTNAKEAWRKNKGKIGLAFMTYVSSAAAAALVESIADAFRDDDDYESFMEKWMQAFFGDTGFDGNFGQDLTIVGKIPVLKDILSTLKGDKSSDMSIASVESISNAYRIWKETIDLATGALEKPTSVTWNGKMTQWGKVYKTLQALSQMSGLPVSNLTRDVVAIWNTTIGGFSPGMRVKTYDPGVKKGIQYAYQDGLLTEEEAAAKLIEAGEAKDNDDAYWKVKGFDGDSKYSGLADSIKDGDKAAFDAAMSELTAHGVSKKTAQSKAKSVIGEMYRGTEKEPASISKSEAVNMLVQYAGVDRSQAELTATNWQCYVDTGRYYDQIRDGFDAGEYNRQTAETYLKKYGGKSADDAAETVDRWEFIGGNEDLEKVTVDAVRKYHEFCAPAGISKGDYADAWNTLKGFTGDDLDGDGKSDAYTKMDKQFRYINGLRLTSAQKTALALASGVNEKSIQMRAPW